MENFTGAKPESEKLVGSNSTEGSNDRVNGNNIVDLVSKNLLPNLDQNGQLHQILQETENNRQQCDPSCKYCMLAATESYEDSVMQRHIWKTALCILLLNKK